jgi:hypothetical protein
METGRLLGVGRPDSLHPARVGVDALRLGLLIRRSLVARQGTLPGLVQTGKTLRDFEIARRVEKLS